jgi:hypothetical protein
MNPGPDWKDITTNLKVFTIWAVTSLIDSAFLALWVCVQALVSNHVTARFELSGIDKWMLKAFEIVFAVSTLVPVIFYVVEDIIRMFLQAQERIRHEKTKFRAQDGHGPLT